LAILASRAGLEPATPGLGNRKAKILLPRE
jgi:hypothetical protein